MEEELDEQDETIGLEEDKQNALCVIYLQHFSTSAGHEVLADLMRTFMYGQSVPLTPESALMDAGKREVVQHIIDKMKAIDKRKAAEAVFEADCI
jgi:hypothetical protein